VTCRRGPNRVLTPTEKWARGAPSGDPSPAASSVSRTRRGHALTSVAPAESLPLPEVSVEIVVSTLVLCSVPDQAAALDSPIEDANIGLC